MTKGKKIISNLKEISISMLIPSIIMLSTLLFISFLISEKVFFRSYPFTFFIVIFYLFLFYTIHLLKKERYFSSNFILTIFIYLLFILILIFSPRSALSILSKYVNIILFLEFILIFGFLLIKRKFNFKIYTITIIFLFLLLTTGFGAIKIFSLNNQDFLWNYDEISCPYELGKYNYILENTTINCNLEENKIQKHFELDRIILKNRYNKEVIVESINLTSNNFNFKFPNEEGKYIFSIKNTKNSSDPYFLLNETFYVISYEKYLSTLEDIENEKRAYFIGSWAFFFASIIFLIQIDNWRRENKKEDLENNDDIYKNISNIQRAIKNISKINDKKDIALREKQELIKETEKKLDDISKKLQKSKNN